jgi:thioredoxin reductase (NADPH)
MKIYDCIVVGAGPAGIIASIQLKRFGHDVLLIERDHVGGLIRNANMIENLLGFPNGIRGEEFIEKCQKQLDLLSIQIVHDEVLRVACDDDFSVITRQSQHQTRAVIVAMGTVPQCLNIPGELKLTGDSLFYEIAGFPCSPENLQVGVIGGGDIAFDYALQLLRRGHSPFILTRGGVSCFGLLQLRADELGIEVYENTHVQSLEKMNDSVEIICEDQRFSCDRVMVAIGRRPVFLDIQRNDSCGIYFAGDCKNGKFRQVHIAAGDGMRTAVSVHQYLLDRYENS